MGEDQLATTPAAGDALETVEQHEWAGDVYEGDDVSDPADAYATMRGPDGSSAWLDRTPDGTMTGWIQDSDGTVYRYTDVDAWALDCDHADFQQVFTSDGVGDVLENEADKTGAPASAPASSADPTMPDEPDADPVDDEDPDAANEPDPADPAEETEPTEDELGEPDPADEESDDVEPDDETPLDDEEDEEDEKKKRLGVFSTIQGKSFPLGSTTSRVVVHGR